MRRKFVAKAALGPKADMALVILPRIRSHVRTGFCCTPFDSGVGFLAPA
jgi:hypothetical protein